ncbi:flagellar protein FliS [Caldanaerobius fijiensis DSM 17918]|uniref:Flagellar secretion chaperone FliS n=1 Tax=Caldanaerobius fijiensis DSM 17918 TaxID=1121256 RepID=A0A1M4UXU4_9THEO|nr:flagellar export chaperone FliS [Caldanaerobius fijiensis]SHE61561.1 flagellar protein FliS [Caldanaerobius fijiensis DSM 17918]
MMINNPYQQYRTDAVMTASPEELTLMLYDGIIRFLNQAKEAILSRDMQTAHEKLIRVQDILNELNATLDRSYDIASNLASIYDFMIRKTIEANIKKDVNIIDEVLEFARDLRNTWQQAMKIARKDSAR